MPFAALEIKAAYDRAMYRLHMFPKLRIRQKHVTTFVTFLCTRGNIFANEYHQLPFDISSCRSIHPVLTEHGADQTQKINRIIL